MPSSRVGVLREVALRSAFGEHREDLGDDVPRQSRFERRGWFVSGEVTSGESAAALEDVCK